MAALRRESRGGFTITHILVLSGSLAGAALLVLGSAGPSRTELAPPARDVAAPVAAFDVQGMVNRYCVVCHNVQMNTAGLGFDTLDASNPAAHPETWEKVVTKLRTGTMPPAGMPRPDAPTYDAAAEQIETQLDDAWKANPNPGRISPIHRLNRTEYNNAVRDLLALDLDVRALLPGDETADGSFDN